MNKIKIQVGFQRYRDCDTCGSHGGYPEKVFLDKTEAEEWAKRPDPTTKHSSRETEEFELDITGLVERFIKRLDASGDGMDSMDGVIAQNMYGKNKMENNRDCDIFSEGYTDGKEAAKVVFEEILKEAGTE